MVEVVTIDCLACTLSKVKYKIFEPPVWVGKVQGGGFDETV